MGHFCALLKSSREADTTILSPPTLVTCVSFIDQIQSVLKYWPMFDFDYNSSFLSNWTSDIACVTNSFSFMRNAVCKHVYLLSLNKSFGAVIWRITKFLLSSTMTTKKLKGATMTCICSISVSQPFCSNPMEVYYPCHNCRIQERKSTTVPIFQCTMARLRITLKMVLPHTTARPTTKFFSER